jgi:hypothetical protein
MIFGLNHLVLTVMVAAGGNDNVRFEIDDFFIELNLALPM